MIKMVNNPTTDDGGTNKPPSLSDVLILEMENHISAGILSMLKQRAVIGFGALFKRKEGGRGHKDGKAM